MEIMLDKKQIRVIFLHKFKIGPKAVETTQNQQGIWPRNCWQTYSAVVVQEVLQWRQEHWKRVAGHQKLTMTNRGWLKLISYNDKRSCPRTQHWPLNGLFRIWSKLKSEKANWGHHFLMGWPKTKKKKKSHFEVSSSLILHNNNRSFLDPIVIWDEKWILHDQEEAPKHFPKPNLHQKKGHSHCFVICWATESWWNHYIWEVCSANHWDAMLVASTG